MIRGEGFDDFEGKMTLTKHFAKWMDHAHLRTMSSLNMFSTSASFAITIVERTPNYLILHLKGLSRWSVVCWPKEQRELPRINITIV